MQRAICQAAAAVAQLELPRGRWPTLLPHLQAAAAAQSAQQRAAALYAFAALAVAVRQHVAPQLGTVQATMVESLAAQDARLRRASLAAASAFVGAPVFSSSRECARAQAHKL